MVEAHDDDVAVLAVGDAGGIEGGHGATGHVVVLGVDDVELLAGVDDGLGDLLGGLGVPVSGLLDDEVPVVVGLDGGVQSAGAADLGGGAHDALDVDDVVGVEALVGQPVNGGLALGVHVGDDGGHVEGLVSVDDAVEQDGLGAGVLGVLERGVPAGGVGGGDEQVLHAVLDELLSGGDLLLVLHAVGELGGEAVLLSEGLLHVLVVGGTVAGLVRVVVDDADGDELAGIGAAAAVGRGTAATAAADESERATGETDALQKVPSRDHVPFPFL